MKTIATLLSLVMALFAAPAYAQTVLKPSDPVTVELKVPAEDAPNVTSTYPISERGTIKLPYLNGEIQAAGMSTTELARRIEAAYRSSEIYTNPTVVVNIGGGAATAGGMAHIVTVGGEVKSGGREVGLRAGMTLYQAIMAAGGFTEFADMRRVKLVRKGRETVIDMKKIGASGAAATVLMDGDVIHVPQN